MARKEAGNGRRRRWLLAGLVVVLVCAGALGYVFGVSSDNKKKRSSSVEAPSSMPSSAPSSSAPAPEPSPSPTPSPSVKPGNPTASPVIAPSPHTNAITVAHTIITTDNHTTVASAVIATDTYAFTDPDDGLGPLHRRRILKGRRRQPPRRRRRRRLFRSRHPLGGVRGGGRVPQPRLIYKRRGPVSS